MQKSYLPEDNKSTTRIYDLALLKTLLGIQSESNFFAKQLNTRDKDQDMIDFLNSLWYDIAKQTKSKLSMEKDGYGNIYVTKGKALSYPCIVSHIDTVHKRVEGLRVYQQNDILFNFSDVEKRQVGTGGDDKVGIFTCLQALLDFDNIKVVFYRDEEIGHLGSRHSILNKPDFYKDCNFILQCDRKGGTDFLTSSAGIFLCSTEFIAAAKPFITKYGFEARNIGVSTDVDTLVREGVGISCVNISSGYYNPHTDLEVVSVKDVGRTYSLVFDLISNIGGEVFPYKHVSTYYKNNYNSGKNKSKYSSSSKNYTQSSSRNLNLFENFPHIEPAVESSNKGIIKELEGMYNILSPVYIPTDLNCPSCKNRLMIGTASNTLKCLVCNKDVDSYFPDWPNDTVVTFTKDKIKKDYLYSYYYNAWVEKENSVLVTENNLNFWVSKQIYERDWKKNN